MEYEPLGQVLHWPHARVPSGAGVARGQDKRRERARAPATRSALYSPYQPFTNRRCITISTVTEGTTASIDGAGLVTLAVALVLLRRVP